MSYKPLKVEWAWAHLPTGDYSLEGCQDLVAIERKSLVDLFGTLGQHRDRFEREMERLAEMDFAALVVEATWEEVLSRPPEHSRLLPKTIFGTHNAWLIRYRVPWIMVEGRRAAEVMTFRLLERWWMEHTIERGEL